jgi:TolB-like protein
MPGMTVFSELKRRNVFQVAMLYLVASWLILQISDVLFGNLGAPDWAFRLVLGLLAVFFVPVLVFTWFFEVTPDGIQRDAGDEVYPSRPSKPGRLSLQIALGLVAMVVAVLTVERLLPASDRNLTGVDGQPAANSRLTIAVLPFAVIGADPEQDYLADGLAEELAHMLSEATDLRVIGRTSAFEFKNRSEDLRAIGSKLGAAFILDGSLQKSEGTLRIRSQLIDARDGMQVWNETYERDERDFFAIQDSIARAVVTALKIEFLSLSYGGDYDSEAYDLYLRGLHELHTRGSEGKRRALEYFRQSIEIDPTIASVWRQLASLYSHNATFWAMDTEEGVNLIYEAIDTALALEPESAEAYAVLGSTRLSFELDWSGANEAFQRAYEIDPDHPATLRALGSLAAAQGDIRRAIELARRRQRVDPLDIGGFHNEGFYLYLDRQFEKAVEAYRRARILSGGPYASGQGMLAMALLAAGRPDEAFKEVQQEPIEPLRVGIEGLVHLVQGERAAADEKLKVLVERYGSRAAVPIAGTYVQMGDFDSAFEWFERAYEQRDAQLLWTRMHPINEPLRGDPRFDALLEKLQLVPRM